MLKHDAAVGIPQPHSVRQRAEQLASIATRADVSAISSEDVQALVYECQVHKIELDLQDEELRRTQVELAEVRNRYVSLYELAPVGYLTLDRDQVIREANLTAATMLGVERGRLLRGRFPAFVAPQCRDECWLTIQEVLTTAMKKACELPFRRADGSEFFGRLEIVPVEPPQSADAVCWITLSDVTDRTHAERALRQSEELLRAVTDCTTYAVYVKDRQSRWLMANPALLCIVGKSAEEVLGRTDAEIFADPAIGQAILENDCRVLERGEPETFEEVAETPDGPRVFLSTKAPRRDAQGQIIGLAGISHDITKRKTAEEMLRQADTELKRSNLELEQFASVAAHDLQEPLRVINGFLKLLQDRYGPQLADEANSYIGYAVESAVRMSDMIRDLLAYSRLDRKGRTVQPLDAGDALAAALADLQATICECNVQIAQDPLPSVTANRTQLTQLFLNLVGNAIKFRKPNQPCLIHVGATPRPQQWVFFVRDNGIGIPADQHDRIFDIFQRLHSRKEYPGTGIGLTICRKIVERHGGRIWLESQPGEGTTFFFSLPRENVA